MDIDELLAQMKKTADRLGLPFGDRTRTYNSRLAQEMGKWAEAEACGPAFHQAAFTAYFVDGRNLALPEVLIDLAVSAGLDKAAAEQVIAGRRYKDAVDRDWRRARDLNIRAVPTFRMGLETLVGAQRYAVLESLVERNGVLRRV